jgi:hypothetical protein
MHFFYLWLVYAETSKFIERVRHARMVSVRLGELSYAFFFFLFVACV